MERLKLSDFAYVSRPYIEDLDIQFRNQEVQITDQPLHIRIYNLIIRNIYPILNVFGFGYDPNFLDLKNTLLEKHITYLSESVDSLQDFDGYIPNLAKLIRSPSLQGEDSLQKKQEIKTRIKDLNKRIIEIQINRISESVDSLQDFDGYILNLAKLIMSPSLQREEEIQTRIKNLNKRIIEIQIDRILKGNLTLPAKITQLDQIQKLPIHDQLITDAKKQARQLEKTAEFETTITELELLDVSEINQNSMNNFFSKFESAFQKTHSEEQYLHLMDIFVKKLVVLMNYNSRQAPIILKLTTEWIVENCYISYLKNLMQNDGFSTNQAAAKTYQEMIVDKISSAIKRQGSQNTKDRNINLFDAEKIKLNATWNLHMHPEAFVEEIRLVLASSEDDMQESDLEESKEAELVAIYEREFSHLGESEREQLQDWLSEAYIALYLGRQIAAPDAEPVIIDGLEHLPKAHSYVTALQMVMHLNSDGNFANFAASLQELENYFLEHLTWMLGEFDQWFINPQNFTQMLIESEEEEVVVVDLPVLQIFTEANKKLWFDQIIFRSFNPDLRKAFHAEAPALANWFTRNADNIMKNRLLLFDVKLIENWAGVQKANDIEQNPLSFFNKDTLLQLYEGNTEKFAKDVGSLIKAEVVEECRSEYDFRKKAHLSVFQNALRRIAGFQFAAIHLHQDMFDKQNIVKRCLMETFPSFFDMDPLMDPVKMDTGGDRQVALAAQSAEDEALARELAAGLE